MEKRYGSLLILITKAQQVGIVNALLTKHSNIILSRHGLPIRVKKISLISLIVEASTQEINALSGQLGRVQYVEIKSCIHKKILETPNS